MSHERTHADDDPQLWEALARWAAGESPPDEAARVRRWLAEDPARARLLDGMSAALHRLEAKPPADLDVEAALRRVHERMDTMPAVTAHAAHGTDPDAAPGVYPDVRHIEGAARRRAERTSRWSSTHLLRAAAAVLIVIGAVYVWRSMRTGPGPALAEAVTYRTAVGQLDTLALPDGAVAILGPLSELTVPADFEATRTVELTGAGLFDVVHEEERPFTVRAGGRTIRDMGTTFTVRTHDEGVEVAVASGFVQVDGVDAREVVDLRAGDRAEIRADGRAAIERGVVTDRDLAWTRGRLVFDNATVARVADELRRWYGIELRWSDPATAQRRITATFQDEDATQVLDVIGAILGASIERGNGTAVIQSTDGAPGR